MDIRLGDVIVIYREQRKWDIDWASCSDDDRTFEVKASAKQCPSEATLNPQLIAVASSCRWGRQPSVRRQLSSHFRTISGPFHRPSLDPWQPLACTELVTGNGCRLSWCAAVGRRPPEPPEQGVEGCRVRREAWLAGGAPWRIATSQPFGRLPAVYSAVVQGSKTHNHKHPERCKVSSIPINQAGQGDQGGVR